ncbi:MAG TPA: hypothetical protein VHQ42_05815, partial [Candidatus Limnocylindria bacterium]|nr:hypothetical protein [Candidatus Limnocylindria bacterium]
MRIASDDRTGGAPARHNSSPRRVTTPMRSTTPYLVVAGVILLVAGVLVLAPSGRGAFGDWLAEARDGDADRGWDLLGPEAQRAYAGNVDAYASDVDGADWGVLE